MPDLTNDDLDRIAEKIVKNIKSSHHEFWIDPENHYLDHMHGREMYQAFSKAQGIAFKAFIGLVVVGSVVLAFIGAGWSGFKGWK